MVLLTGCCVHAAFVTLTTEQKRVVGEQLFGPNTV